MKQQPSEAEFLADYNIHNYDIPLTSVDMAIFTIRHSRLEVLLVKRAQHPALGQWALPGGFIDLTEDLSLEDTAHRKLREKTGVDSPYLEQVTSIGNRHRDPRSWSVTVVYFALIASENLQLHSDSSSEDIAWVDVEELAKYGQLAFDHEEILRQCEQRLKAKVQYTSIPVHLIGNDFTLSEL